PELGARPVGHGRRSVDEEVDGEVFFFLVEAEEELLAPLVDVEVERADVVALDVVAVIGELDAGAGLLARALGAEAPAEDAPRGERERVQLAHEGFVEEISVR